MIGNILLGSQWVEFYQAETLYLGGSIASSAMQKSTDDQALEAMRANLEALKTEKGLRNPALAKKAGVAATKTVNNLERGRHDVGVAKVAAVALALDVELWQFFVKDLPVSPKERSQLARLVRAFILLGIESRETLLADVRVLCSREGKLDQLNKETNRHPKPKLLERLE
jgi:transcriptional regulator with XRE-family HTH domain